MAKEMVMKTFGIMGLVRDLKSGVINRDAEMQRSFVWANKDQTDLIDSVFQNATTYIPPLIGAESDHEIEIKGKLERVTRLLDGKQRATTIERFVNNELKLGNNIRPVVIEQEDGTNKTYIVAGKTWDELEEEVKLLFKACKIQMVFFKDMSLQEQELQFIKLQGGKKLSNAEINKVRIGGTVREFIYRQLATDLWTKYANISSNREVKFEAMQQVLMVLTDRFELSGKALQKFSESNNSITIEIMEQVEAITEYLNSVTRIIKTQSLPKELQSLEESEVLEKLDPKLVKKYRKPIEFLKKVHTPIIYSVANKAIENNITPEQFSEFIIKFFEDIDARYKRFSESDSASSSSVIERLDIMTESLVEAFKITEKSITDTAEPLQDSLDSQEQQQDQDSKEDSTNAAR